MCTVLGVMVYVKAGIRMVIVYDWYCFKTIVYTNCMPSVGTNEFDLLDRFNVCHHQNSME